MSPREPNRWNSNPINTKRSVNFFHRAAYHLFASNMPSGHVSELLQGTSTENVLASNMVVAEMYRRILGRGVAPA